MFVLVVEQSPLECRKLEGWLKDMGHEANSGAFRLCEGFGKPGLRPDFAVHGWTARQSSRILEKGPGWRFLRTSDRRSKLDDVVACMKVVLTVLES